MEKNMRELLYNDVYEELIDQFTKLPNRYKNSLLVYKTRLGLLINDLENNPDFELFYRRYKEIYDNPVNAVLRCVLFNYLDMSSVDTFIRSIYSIKSTLDEATSKLQLPEDVIVYRGISSNSDISGIAKGNIISTTLSFVETDKYTTGGDSVVINEVRIPAGSPVAISPYKILDDGVNNRLVAKISSEEEEIILNANNYMFKILESYPGKISFNVYQAENKKARN